MEEAFRMAVRGEFTFERKPAGVVGLQDGIILASVLDHVGLSPMPSAFVSKDAVFERLPKIITIGTTLEWIQGLDALENVLKQALALSFDNVFDTWWDEETERDRNAIRAQFPAIAQYLEQSIDPEQMEKLFGSRVVSASPPSVVDVDFIRPDFKREESDPHAVSCVLRVTFFAVVERPSNTSSLARTLGLTLPPSPGDTLVQVSESRDANVDFACELSPDYTTLAPKTASLKQ
jgi:hypothetical protein